MGKGKASRWLRSLLGTKNSPSSSAEPSPPSSSSPKDKKKTSSDSKWGLIKSSLANDKSLGGGARWSHGDPSSNPHVELDANKHAIAVAAATAAVAEAALAAAQAAAEVVRLTSAATSVGGTARTVSSPPVYAGSREWRREVAAAIKIQSAFRAYLAGRALRALKGLVKLQALVRGHIVRKQSADMLRRMQAMARIQARASATRINVSESPNSKATPAPQKHDIAQHSYSAKHEGPKLKRRVSKPNISNSIKVEGLHLGSSWLDRWMEECKWNKQKDTSLKNISRDDEKSVKILEIDTWKPHYNPRQSDKTFRASQVFRAWNDNGQGVATFDAKPGIAAKHQKPNLTVSSGDVPNLRPLKFPPQEDQAWTADNSPCLHSASSRAGCSSRKCPFTPTRSECSRSVYGDYLSHPSYMANTESSLAKVRSQSAPKQRTQYERLGMMNRKSVPGLWDVDTISEKGSTPHTNLRINAYRSSGLESRRMPVQGDAMDLSAAYHSRH